MSGSKRTLIFGMSGLLGSHLGRELSEYDSLLGTYYKNKLDQKGTIRYEYSNSLDELEAVLSDFRPEVVLNASGLVSVDGCEQSPIEALHLNTNFLHGLIYLLDKLSLNNCHLVQISTAAVYGNHLKENNQAWLESDVTKPLSVYASTKLAAELITISHSGPSTIIRSDIYGINSLSEKSLMWWIMNSAYQGERMEGWENILFNPISAGHLSKIVRFIIENEITGLYNIGCINKCNKYDFAAAVCKAIEIEAHIERAELVNDTLRPYNTITDCSKFFGIKDLGLSWEEDLKNYIKTMPRFPKDLRLQN